MCFDNSKIKGENVKLNYRFGQAMAVHMDEWSPYTYIEPFHWHPELEVGLCLSGKGRFYFGDKTYEVSAGDVFVVNNLERHIAQSDPMDPSKYLFVYFKPEMLDGGDKELLLPFVYNPKRFTNKIDAKLPAAQRIGELMLRMREEQLAGEAGYGSMMKGLMLQICSLLYRHYSTDEFYRESFKLAYDQFMRLQPVLAYLRQHFREDVALEDMAKLLGLSSSRARHLFKQIMGEGFKEYVTQLRINEAKSLLAATDWTVTEVCMSSGFQNISPFYRAFRDITGMTPQQYREQADLAVLHGAGDGTLDYMPDIP